MPTLAEALARKRASYDAERIWYRFLHDAHTGGGGFQGCVRQPASGYWGWAAEAYAASSSRSKDAVALQDTYLDRYPREDQDKFNARVAVAHYPNYVGPLTNLKTAYILRKEFTRSEVPEEVSAWHEDVNGKGTTFAEVRAELVPRAAEIGWVPVLIDMDPVPEGIVTAAQAAQVGAGTPRLVPLHPANILEWFVDELGTFEWVKILTTHVRQTDWLSDPVTIHRYTVWTPSEAIVYEANADSDADPVEVQRGTHPFGRVPLTILRHGRDDDGVRGEAMHGGVAIENRRLFNLTSELDEHIRSQAFAILVLIAGSVGQQGEVRLSTDQGLPLSPDSKNQHYYLAPPASVAETLEKRIAETIREIYRQAGVEFVRPQSAAAASGIARRYEFAQTDAQLVKFAKSIAEWELDVDDLVGMAYGVSDEVRQAETITPPASFDIEDIASEIRNALDAISVGIGATAKRLLRLRVIQGVLQRLSPEERETIEQELEVLAQDELQSAAALSQRAAEQPTGSGDGDDDAAEDDVDGDDPSEEDDSRQAA